VCTAVSQFYGREETVTIDRRDTRNVTATKTIKVENNGLHLVCERVLCLLKVPEMLIVIIRE